MSPNTKFDRPMIPRTIRPKQLVEWVIFELPEIAPDGSRTQRAVDLAGVLWERSRD